MTEPLLHLSVYHHKRARKSHIARIGPPGELAKDDIYDTDPEGEVFYFIGV